MELIESERRVVEAAEALARSLGHNENHTVAAAVMDVDGRIHEGVNVYHFNGGPCAELVALGVAATAGADRLLTIAAAGDRGRGLIPPCGRCRQVLLDHHPDIVVAVPTDQGAVGRSVRELLPDTYFHPDADSPRIVRFNTRHHDAVMSGSKTTTIRWNDPIAVGSATFVFEGHPDFVHVDGEVLATDPVSVDDLTPEYVNGLRENYYPTMPHDAQLVRVTFRIMT